MLTIHYCSHYWVIGSATFAISHRLHGADVSRNAISHRLHGVAAYKIHISKKELFWLEKIKKLKVLKNNFKK